jgi:hypothetical protein
MAPNPPIEIPAIAPPEIGREVEVGEGLVELGDVVGLGVVVGETTGVLVYE